MRIWVDADACPRPVKDVVFRASERRNVRVTLVANRPLHTPKSDLIDVIVVTQGFDVADERIVDELATGDLVVTADVPLAAQVLERGGHAVNPRGELYTEENIGERLSVRDFMDELRSTGIQTGGPPAFGPKDVQAFANQLDRFLTRHGC
jgi:hypothetical protein